MSALLSSFAGLPLAPAGQEALCRAGTYTRQAFAASPFTHIDLVDRLVRDRDVHVRKFACLRTSDTVLVDDLIRAERAVASPYAARNIAASPDVLAAALNSSVRTVALAAWCNPATPEHERRKLTPDRAVEICHIGGSNHDRSVRAYELVINNPWMVASASVWDGQIRRAIAGSPLADAATLDALRKSGRAGMSTARKHPAYDRSLPPLSRWSLASLLAWDCPATQLLAVEHPELTDENAVKLMTVECEPHIIARAYRRFGAVVAAERGEYSGTRRKAAEWVSPGLVYASFWSRSTAEDARAAAGILGENALAWETFRSLTGDWHGTLTQAAHTACTL